MNSQKTLLPDPILRGHFDADLEIWVDANGRPAVAEASGLGSDDCATTTTTTTGTSSSTTSTSGAASTSSGAADVTYTSVNC